MLRCKKKHSNIYFRTQNYRFWAPRVGFIRTSESEDGIAYRYGVAANRITYGPVAKHSFAPFAKSATPLHFLYANLPSVRFSAIIRLRCCSVS